MFRLVIFVLLVLSLLGLSIPVPVNGKFVVFLVDRSRSIDQIAAKTADEFLKEAKSYAGKVPTETVYFPSVSDSDAVSDADKNFPQMSDETGTNIAEAIEEAVACWKKQRSKSQLQIVLISDGNETATDAFASAKKVGAQISTVPLPAFGTSGSLRLGDSYVTGIIPEVQISGFCASKSVRVGEPFNFELLIRSNRDTKAEINIFIPCVVIEPQFSLHYPSGKARVNEASKLQNTDHVQYKTNNFLESEKKRIIAETVELHVGDNIFTLPYVIKNDEEYADAAKNGITFSAQLDVREDTVPENNFAATALQVAPKPKVLIVDNKPSEIRTFESALQQQDIDITVCLPDAIPKALNQFEEYDAVIFSNVSASQLSEDQAEIIREFVNNGGGFLMLGSENSFGLGGYYKTPIDAVLPVRCDFVKERKTPPLALLILLDRSSSMSGDKLELAKDATKSVFELLTEQDYFGVIAFDQDVHNIVPLQRKIDENDGINTGVTNAVEAISKVTPGGGTNIYKPLCEAVTQFTAPLPSPSASDEVGIKHVLLLTDGFSEPGDFDSVVSQLRNMQITVSTVGVGDADYTLLEKIATQGGGRFYSCTSPEAVPQIFAQETITASKAAIEEEPFFPVVAEEAALHFIEKEVSSETANALPSPPLLGFVVTEEKPGSEMILRTETGEPLLCLWRYGLGISAAFTSDARNHWAAEWTTAPEFQRFWAETMRQIIRRPKDTEKEIVADLCHAELRFSPTNYELLRNIADITNGLFNPTPKEIFSLNTINGKTRDISLTPFFLALAAFLFVFKAVVYRKNIR
ncbi:MAG: VWA domain-containing protein [Thermoguttaceae bacterium]